MLTRNSGIQDELIFQTLDELVPEDHLVRKLDVLDYTFIYDQVKDLYSPDGRPSIDPVMLFKILIIKTVFKLPSIYKTLKEIEVNLAYRWFIKLPLSLKMPHYSVVYQNLNNRFNTQQIGDTILKNILQKVLDLKIVSSKELDLSQLNLTVYQTFENKEKIIFSENTLYETTLV
jgi:transposase